MNRLLVGINSAIVSAKLSTCKLRNNNREVTMGFFSRSKTPKIWTGHIIDK